MTCTVCGIASKFHCGSCAEVRYCGSDCQVAHWNANHRFTCDLKKPVVDQAWPPSIEELEKVPPLPSRIRAKIKTELDLSLALRIRAMQWQEIYLEHSFKTLLQKAGYGEVLIGRIFEKKADLRRAFQAKFKNGVLASTKDLEAEIEEFRLLLGVQAKSTGSDALDTAYHIVRQGEFLYDSYPDKGDEEMLYEEDIMRWKISTQDIWNAAQIGNDGNRPTVEQTNNPHARAAIDFAREAERLASEEYRQKTDEGHLQSNRMRDRKTREERISSWRDTVIAILAKVPDVARDSIQTLYNGALTAMLALTPDRRGTPGKKFYFTMVVLAGVITGAHFGWLPSLRPTSQADNARDVARGAAFVGRELQAELNATGDVDNLTQNILNCTRKMLKVQEDIRVADTTRGVIFNPAEISKGTFLLDSDTEKTLVAGLGPEGFRQARSEFSKGLEENINADGWISKWLFRGVPTLYRDGLRERVLSADASDAEFNKQLVQFAHKFNGFSDESPAVKGFAATYAGAVAQLRNEKKMLDGNVTSLNNKLLEIQSNRLPHRVASSARDISEGVFGARFAFAAQNTVFSVATSLLENQAVVQFLSDSLFTAQTLLDSYTGTSFFVLWASLLCNGGMRVVELAAGTLATVAGKLSKFFAVSGQRLTTKPVGSDETAELIRSILGGFQETSNRVSALGLAVCSLLSTTFAIAETMAGGANVALNIFNGNSVFYTMVGVLLWAGIEIAQHLGSFFFPEIPSVLKPAAWNAGMLMVVAVTTNWRTCGYAALVNFADYQRTLPTFLGGEREFSSREKLGMGLSLAHYAYMFHSAVVTDVSRTIISNKSTNGYSKVLGIKSEN